MILALATLAAASTPTRAAASLTLIIDRQSGDLTLQTDSPEPLIFAAYAITSSAGALAPDAWLPIADTAPDDPWTILAANPAELAEATLGSLTLTPGEHLTLGSASLTGPFEDLALQYILGDGQILPGQTTYLGDPLPLGDLNADGDLTAADWNLYKTSYNADLANLTPAQAYLQGDLTGDGLSDQADFRLLKSQFIAQGLVVPAPNSFAAVGAITLGRIIVRRHAREIQS